MGPKPKKTEVVALRLEPALKKAIDEIAEREHRTTSQQVRKFVLEALSRAGVRVPGLLKTTR